MPAETVRVVMDAASPQWQISGYLTGMHFVYGSERDSLDQERVVRKTWL